MEYPINKIICDNLAAKVMRLQRIIPAGEGWSISVSVVLGEGHLIATNEKTGATISLYLGFCTIKQ